MRESLRTARALLEHVTPIHGDCGQLCGKACCSPDEEGKGGVWLLPGEESFFPAAWVRPGDPPRLMCRGSCDRRDRPFFCRIFPLIGIKTQKGWRVRLDQRAWALCPLMSSGLRGLAPAFTAAAERAVELLAADPELRPFLRRWAAVERTFHRVELGASDHGPA